MPQQSKAGAFSGGSSGAKASQLPSTGEGMQSKSITTKGGSEITVAGGKGSGTTPGGADVGGAAGGIKVEGPGGNTAAKGGAVAGGSKNGNSAIAGGSAKGIETAGGAKAASGKSAAAIAGAGGAAVASRGASAVQGKGGAAAANVRGGYASTTGAGRVGSAAAIRGPGGNTVVAGRGAAFANGQFVGGRTWGAVNGNFNRWNYFTPGWIAGYPGAWWPGKWAIATTAWAATTWALTGGYAGCAEYPVYYDYSETVTYQDDMVYYGDEPVATAEAYFDQAELLAVSGEEAVNEDWLPLGVFAVVQEEQTTADKLVQLAVNKEGIIRGNYQDMISNKVTPLLGAVDKETQRVALKIEGNDSLVAETGLYNLTNDEAPVLIHFGPDRQESRIFVRLQQPEEQEK
jgi:hypothetical protein